MHQRALAVVAFVVVALWPTMAGASTPPEWEEPVQLGAELPSSWFPDIQADAAGDVRIVFSAALIEGDANEIDGLNGAVMISELGPEGWSDPSDIAVMDGGIASRPMIASDGQYAHLIYRTAAVGDPVPVVYSRAPLTSDLGDTRSWSEPYKIASDEAYWAQLALLPEGGLLITYNRMSEVVVDGQPQRRTGIFARHSDDQGETWSDEIRVAVTTERVARTSLTVVPGTAQVVLAWDEGYDNMSAQGEPVAIATAVSADGGLTWTDQQRFAVRAEQSFVISNGPLTMLLYRSVTDDTIYYRTSDDGGRTWLGQAAVPDVHARPYGSVHNFEKISAAFDGDGRLLFTWVGPNEDAPNGLSVMLTTYAEDGWTEPEVIASPVGFPEYPRIAVALGNQVQIVFFVRDKEFDIGSYTMWTMSATSDAAAIEPQAFEAVYAPVSVVPTQVPVTIQSAPAAPGVTTPADDVTGWDAAPQKTLTSPIVPILVTTVAGLLVAAALRLGYAYLRDTRI